MSSGVVGKIDLAHAPRLIFLAHLACIAAIFGAFFLSRALADSGVTSMTGNLFNPEAETSIPNFFSAVMLCFAGLCAAAISTFHIRSQRMTFWFWMMAAAVLVALGFDEGAAIHDRLRGSGTIVGGGAFYMGWTLPYFMLTVAALPILYVFFRRLPATTRRRLSLAAVLYVVGALGMEMIEGIALKSHVGPDVANAQAIHARKPPLWTTMIVIEEFLEMLAVALGIRAMLLHLVQNLGVHSVVLVREEAVVGAFGSPADLTVPAAARSV